VWMTAWWPQTADSRRARGLAGAPPPPPAANGTTSRTYRFGKVCALATCGVNGSAAAPAARRRNRLRWGSFIAGLLDSLRLDIRRPDHLAPLLDFVGDELAELGGRARTHPRSQISKPRPLARGCHDR